MRNGIRAGWWVSLIVSALVVQAAYPVDALAQQAASPQRSVPPGFYLTPSVTVSERYDDNIFGTEQNPPPTLVPSTTPGAPPVLVPAQKKQDDFIFRAAPGISGGYNSAPFSILAGYSIAADIYAKNSDQDAFPANQMASLETHYLPNPLLDLSATGGFNQSETPGELNSAAIAGPAGLTATGIQNGKSRTELYYAGSTASYKLSQLYSLLGSYTFNHLNQVGVPSQDEHTAEATLSRVFTQVDIGDLGYVYRHFNSSQSQTVPPPTLDGSVTVVNTPSVLDSNTVRVGWTHRFSELTEVTLRGGPIFTGSHINPDAYASITRSFEHGSANFTYANTQTSAVGIVGALTTQSYIGSLTYSLTQLWSANLSGGYTTSENVEGTSNQTDVWLASLGSRYQLLEWMAIVLNYSFWSQKGVFSTVQTPSSDVTIHNSNQKIYHNIVSIGVEVSKLSRVY